jgi:protein-disulfide isomerase
MPQTLLDNVAAEAESLDVSGTPTVFVNGERVRFSEGYAENLLEAIQTALGGPEI